MNKIIISPNNNEKKPILYKFPMDENVKKTIPNIICDCGTSYPPCDTTHFQTIIHRKFVDFKAKMAELQFDNQPNDDTTEIKQTIFKKRGFNINIET